MNYSYYGSVNGPSCHYRKLAKYNKKEFYKLNILCEGDAEDCKANVNILKELVELVKSIYENDMEIKRIEKIK